MALARRKRSASPRSADPEVQGFRDFGDRWLLEHGPSPRADSRRGCWFVQPVCVPHGKEGVHRPQAEGAFTSPTHTQEHSKVHVGSAGRCLLGGRHRRFHRNQNNNNVKAGQSHVAARTRFSGTAKREFNAIGTRVAVISMHCCHTPSSMLRQRDCPLVVCFFGRDREIVCSTMPLIGESTLAFSCGALACWHWKPFLEALKHAEDPKRNLRGHRAREDSTAKLERGRWSTLCILFSFTVGCESSRTFSLRVYGWGLRSCLP